MPPGKTLALEQRARLYESLLGIVRSRLMAIARNDKTTYRADELRADGMPPGTFGATWKTPRELSLEALELIEPWLRHVIDCSEPALRDVDPEDEDAANPRINAMIKVLDALGPLTVADRRAVVRAAMLLLEPDTAPAPDEDPAAVMCGATIACPGGESPCVRRGEHAEHVNAAGWKWTTADPTDAEREEAR